MYVLMVVWNFYKLYLKEKFVYRDNSEYPWDCVVVISIDLKVYFLLKIKYLK